MLRKLCSGLLVAAVAVVLAPQMAMAITGDHASIGTAEPCGGCHAPHHTTGTTPLWYQTVTGETFTMYPDTDLAATIGTGPPTGSSLLCLSCHDGVTLVRETGLVITGGPTEGGVVIGTDLSNDHPVSFDFPTETGLALVAAVEAGDLVLETTAKRMECATCHDAHDDGLGSYLRVTNTGSAICLVCHINK